MSPLSPLSKLMLKLWTSLGSDECSAALFKNKSSSSIGSVASPLSQVTFNAWFEALLLLKLTGLVPYLSCASETVSMAGGHQTCPLSVQFFKGRPTFRRLKPYRPHPSSPVVFIYHTCGPISPHVYNEIKMVTFCSTFRGLCRRSSSLTFQL